MKVQKKPFCGALALAGFITVCLFWMVSGLGESLSWALYGLVFVLSTAAIYTFAIKLAREDGDGRPASLEAVDELKDPQ